MKSGKNPEEPVVKNEDADGGGQLALDEEEEEEEDCLRIIEETAVDPKSLPGKAKMTKVWGNFEITTVLCEISSILVARRNGMNRKSKVLTHFCRFTKF